MSPSEAPERQTRLQGEPTETGSVKPRRDQERKKECSGRPRRQRGCRLEFGIRRTARSLHCAGQRRPLGFWLALASERRVRFQRLLLKVRRAERLAETRRRPGTNI